LGFVGFPVGHRDTIYEVTGLAEARGRYARVLGIVKLHAMSDGLAQGIRDRLVAHAEIPQLWRYASAHVLTTAVIEGDFALGSFADPTTPYELLEHTSALALCICPIQREPSPRCAA
jgi:hypothetical protein